MGLSCLAEVQGDGVGEGHDEVRPQRSAGLAGAGRVPACDDPTAVTCQPANRMNPASVTASSTAALTHYTE